MNQVSFFVDEAIEQLYRLGAPADPGIAVAEFEQDAPVKQKIAARRHHLSVKLHCTFVEGIVSVLKCHHKAGV
jgi:hypothetical protein